MRATQSLWQGVVFFLGKGPSLGKPPALRRKGYGDYSIVSPSLRERKKSVSLTSSETPGSARILRVEELSAFS